MEPIAIVGISCRFAGAPHPGALWRMIMHQKSAISPFGEDMALMHGAKNLFDCPYPTHGGLLGSLYSCDAREQSFPGQLNAGENQDLYFAVQLAFDAITDAAMRPHSPDPVRGSVRFGYAPPFNASTVNWLEHTFFIDQTMEIINRFFPNAPADSMDSLRAQLVESLPEPNSKTFLMGAGHRVAGWIARECSFYGAATTLDSGIMSGVAAISDAIDDLRSGRADVALAGALTPPLSRAFIEGISGEILFSMKDDLVPFDRGANGTIPGEGGVFFVLKRRSDALRARDRIYALVKSVVCGDIPQADIMAIAADRAEAPVKSIQLIEADGSGIPELDAEEVATIQRLWGDHRPGDPLVGIGSVKGNIGHCLRAASAVSVLKATLALHARVLPPQMPSARPLNELSNLGSSVYLLNEPRPWIIGNSTSPRRAAVLVNDFTGRRATMILEEEPYPEDRK